MTLGWWFTFTYFRQMKSAPSVSFHTLGCKLNFAESSAIARHLKDAGFQKVELENGADVVVINTCSVTQNADRECRAIVRKAIGLNPDSFIAVIGCYAQLKPEEIASMEGVDLVLGATEKFNLVSYLNSLTKKNNTEVHSCEIEDAGTFTLAYSFGDRTRAFLKVQDGCDYTCSYCTIPRARGSSRSDTIENIVSQAGELAQKGVKEIVLTGVNIGDYGIIDTKDKNRGQSFIQLIRALDEVDGIDRFRISSIEPNLLTDEIISFVAGSRRFVPHFHNPLQSGSDTILALMRRRYRTRLYADRISYIRSVIPQACIGADVIVGFPGETQAEFMETYTFLQQLDISYLHVFTYSERDHTDAAQMRQPIPQTER